MAQERKQVEPKLTSPALTRLQHDGNLPKTPAEKKEFKSNILAMRVKPDEENFEEAEAQAWRVWSEPAVSRLSRYCAL